MTDTLIAERFLRLFPGNEERHGRCVVGETRNENGKLKCDARTWSGGPTLSLWRDHLDGKVGLGAIPIRGDGTCEFGAIDIDEYRELNHGVIVRQLAAWGVPALVVRSKSGGAHIFVWANTGIPAPLFRERLSEIAEGLNLPPEIEIFPKQDTPTTDEGGSWISFPFYGGWSGMRWAVKPDGDAMEQDEFLDVAEKLKSETGLEWFNQKLRLSRMQPASCDITAGERASVGRIMQNALRLISRGVGRNDSGYWFFAQLLNNTYTREDAKAVLQEFVDKANAATPGKGEYTTKEAGLSLHSAFKKRARDPWTKGKGKGQTQAEVLEKLSQDLELFHNSTAESFARVPMADHFECWAVKSERFRGILYHRYYRKQNSTPSKEALQSFLELLCARAQYDGPQRETFLRFAHFEGRIYLDLARESWEVVEIDAHGWRVLADSPVCFRRVRGMKALPIPVRGGSLDVLRQFINARDSQWVLMVSWLVGCFLPQGAFPILLLQGTQGSAKSTTATLLRNLIDPVTVALSAPPPDQRELAITALNSGIVSFDNLSGVHLWLSDALCRMVSGAGFVIRSMYTNSEQELFETQRPLLLNGIDDIASRADLLDRGIGVTLDRISDEERRTEEDIYADFNEAHSGILGALLDAVSAGLLHLKSTKLPSLPRMADFAKWVSACEPALPWAPGCFAVEYRANRQRAAESSVENDPVAAAIVRLAESCKPGFWQGSASDLLLSLNGLIDYELRDKERWPRAPNGLTRSLRRAEPSLEAVGVKIEYLREPWPGREKKIKVSASDVQRLLPFLVEAA